MNKWFDLELKADAWFESKWPGSVEKIKIAMIVIGVLTAISTIVWVTMMMQ